MVVMSHGLNGAALYRSYTKAAIEHCITYKGAGDCYGTLNVYTTTVNADGKRSTTGGADLKGTQSYPDGFGEALRCLAHQNRAVIEEGMQRMRVQAQSSRGALAADEFEDANLEDVVDFLCQDL